jgi:hypothetical protein
MVELQLITEGRTDRTLLENLLDHLARGIDIPRFAPKDNPDAGGYNWLVQTGRLDSFLRVADIKRFGIVVDADRDAAAKWDSLRGRLIAFGYAESLLPRSLDSNGLVVKLGTRPLGVWLMPDNVSPGNVEDFFTSLIQPSDPLIHQARKCVGSIAAELIPESGRSKAIYRTWLAWQKGGDGMSPRTAHHANLYDSAKAASFLRWIDRLLATPAEVE